MLCYELKITQKQLYEEFTGNFINDFVKTINNLRSNAD